MATAKRRLWMVAGSSVKGWLSPRGLPSRLSSSNSSSPDSSSSDSSSLDSAVEAESDKLPSEFWYSLVDVSPGAAPDSSSALSSSTMTSLSCLATCFPFPSPLCPLPPIPLPLPPTSLLGPLWRSSLLAGSPPSSASSSELSSQNSLGRYRLMLQSGVCLVSSSTVRRSTTRRSRGLGARFAISHMRTISSQLRKTISEVGRGSSGFA